MHYLSILELDIGYYLMYHASETSVIPYFHMQLYFNILIIFQDSYLVLYYGNEFITAQMHLLTSR